MKAKKPKRRSKRKKLSPLEKEQRAFARLIQKTITDLGFREAKSFRDKFINFMDEETDIDGLYIHENVLLLCEYTVKKNDLSEHVKKKKTAYDKITLNNVEFIKYLRTLDKDGEISFSWSDQLIEIRILYFSKNDVDRKTKIQVPDVIFVDFSHLRYFETLAKTVRKASIYEFFEFIKLKYDDYCPGTGAGIQKYEGSLLPESNSNFDEGYKVVSFYIDPEALLKRAYVLRKDGWKDSQSVYQRMIEKPKIDAIRRYLVDKRRVFINNIIVTLPSNTHVVDEKGKTVDYKTLTKTKPVSIQVPNEFNSVGIIDGQHRVFSYYEGGLGDDQISILRKQLNLLVTGIISPENIDETDKLKFEAELFLEINSNQTNARTDLKQAIQKLTAPYSLDAIGRLIVEKLNDHSGPLGDVFVRNFYDSDKVKTSSIVSFGLRPLIKMSGSDSLFSTWEKEDKNLLVDAPTGKIRDEYIDFCFNEINNIFVAFKKVIPDNRWTSDAGVSDRFLTVVNINGVLICLRKIIENDKSRSVDFYVNKLSKTVPTFGFSNYHSSQYNKMASDLYQITFS